MKKGLIITATLLLAIFLLKGWIYRSSFTYHKSNTRASKKITNNKLESLLNKELLSYTSLTKRKDIKYLIIT